MNIPFSKPLIDKDVVSEVNDCLSNTGWLTTGPKTRELEEEIKSYTMSNNVLCVNSWTSAAMLILKWYGIKKGDEVIIPSYSYSATALCIINSGANAVMVDVCDDFNIDINKIKSAITTKTKAIMPVDIGGFPCCYDKILELLNQSEVKRLFNPENDIQKKLGRILLMSDSAHSIGAKLKGKHIAQYADFTLYSFHSVKNITSGEGGAICENLPNDKFDNKSEFTNLKYLSLNGQTKSAFEKYKIGGWRYDIIYPGLKINMPDVCASIALAQIKKYESKLLPERKKIFEKYNTYFKKLNWAILPPQMSKNKESSYHLYMIRIKNMSENDRDLMIEYISKKNVGVNVHYIPMPMLTIFQKLGYDINNYPNTYKIYSNEITLPVYNGLTNKQVSYVCRVVSESYKHITNNKQL